MYSKLGGCLSVTAKLGPLARTDLWAGVKGLLDRLMTHLGLGSSFEEPWLDLPGGMGVGLPFQEVVLTSWEGCVGLCLGGCLLPCLPSLGGYDPAQVVLEGWGELFPSLCIRREEAWDELTSSKGRCKALGRELLPSPGGRWAVAGLGRLPGAWIVGELLPSEEGCTVARGELLPSPGGRWAMASVWRLPIAWLAGLGWLLITWLLGWGRPVPSGRRWPVAGGIASFSRRKESNDWGGVVGICLTNLVA